MAEDDLNDKGLEAFFAAGRENAPVPSDALLARVMADAEAEMVRPAEVAVLRPAARPGFLRAAVASIGGWAGLGGLATATAAGVWIGFVGLADPLDAGGLITPSLSVELMPGADSFMTASAEE
ncbi:MAG TPA: hypothetical protein PLI43_07035 [Albidovulum sp.]|uniref:hypothetical protein n=1 Tax=Albidovulum sp. TaxID=1872424 RepID=UPI002C9ECAD8|nr:hypothetical protein [Albidovulum sp.]